jgi:hypothetical protein
MERYEGPQTTLIIALLIYLYLAFILDMYDGPQTSLTIASLGGIHLAIIMD